MSQFAIREAVLSDIPALRALEQQLIEYEQGIEPTMRQKGNFGYFNLSNLIIGENSWVLVVEEQGEIVGCGLGFEKKNLSFRVHERYGYIGLLFVKEGYRGKSISRMIIDELKVRFKQIGISELQLEVYATNTNARELYEYLGFSDYIIYMKTNI